MTEETVAAFDSDLAIFEKVFENLSTIHKCNMQL